MGSRLEQTVRRWASALGITDSRIPRTEGLEELESIDSEPLNPPATLSALASWEYRHGFELPRGLRAWLELSDGFHPGISLIHPLSAIGPMVPFARVPGLLIQPESWFELGNPETETICVDLAYLFPGGGHPIFTSGDDERGSPPRIIARSFEEWFLSLLSHGGREFWFDEGFESLGDPWWHHKQATPPPDLPTRLDPLAQEVLAMIGPENDEGRIASRLGVSRLDVEMILRRLQHTTPHLIRPR